jgi:endonuclease/exonuclease/phosphatase family metal-dependent hydrolase
MKLSIFSLNLHGYHPMGEPGRFIEDRDGRVRPAGAYPMGEGLHFFTTDELDHGHRRRLDRLGRDLARLAPDIICLQEVAAGSPWTHRDAEAFGRVFPDDWFESNSALRLTNRLNHLTEEKQPWQPALACRGNIGWVTGPGTFAQGRIVAFTGSQKHIIHDFDANPYPEGLLVEGFAVLVRKPWEIVDQQEWDLVTNSLGHKAFIQAVRVRHGARWLVLANVHMGHKVTHFEQAVVLRSALLDYRRSFADPENCLGIVIAGDYNAFRYRPHDGIRDAGMIPWEPWIEGQYDFRPRAETFGNLLTALWACNDDHGYKPWASIRDLAEARRRLDESAERFWSAQEKAPDDWLPLVEGLDQASRKGAICSLDAISSTASIPDRIDFIYADPALKVQSACVVYPENTFSFNTGTSDHPAVLVNYEV